MLPKPKRRWTLYLQGSQTEAQGGSTHESAPMLSEARLRRAHLRWHSPPSQRGHSAWSRWKFSAWLLPQCDRSKAFDAGQCAAPGGTPTGCAELQVLPAGKPEFCTHYCSNSGNLRCLKYRNFNEAVCWRPGKAAVQVQLYWHRWRHQHLPARGTPGGSVRPLYCATGPALPWSSQSCPATRPFCCWCVCVAAQAVRRHRPHA